MKQSDYVKTAHLEDMGDGDTLCVIKFEDGSEFSVGAMACRCWEGSTSEWDYENPENNDHFCGTPHYQKLD